MTNFRSFLGLFFVRPKNPIFGVKKHVFWGYRGMGGELAKSEADVIPQLGYALFTGTNGFG